MSHWPSSAGACAPFFACCPARHAAGRPLNSNVRRQTQATRYAGISIQVQRLAAIRSIQNVAPFPVAFAKVVAEQNTCLASNAVLTSFGVREPHRLFAYSQNPRRTPCLPLMAPQTLWPSGGSSW
jgi:hypothetical protein